MTIDPPAPRFASTRARRSALPIVTRVGLAVGVAGLVGAVAVGACSAVSPPPLIPMHAGTAPRAAEATTLTFVVGFAGEALGGGGWGVAVRGERQLDDGTAVGVQLGGGRGDEGELDDDKRELRHWLLELRGYGRLGSTRNDWIAGLASFGVTTMDTGMVATTLAAGVSFSHPNQYAVPALGAFAAVSTPWRRGRGFGASHDKVVHTTYWLGLSGAVVVPLGDSGHAASLEGGFATAYGPGDGGQLSLSLADSYTY
jgi:hypothetical protein